MNKLTKIVTFISVIEEKSFSAAARKKNISTAAISRQINKLESELECQLLKRSTRQIELTEVGSQYYEQVKKTIAELREAELAIISNKNEATGVLYVSTGRYFANEYFLSKLPEFMRLNPKLRIKIEFSEHFSDLLQEPIDVIFGSTNKQSPGIVQRRIGSSRFVMCASPDYLNQYGVPKVPSDLKYHKYITHSGRVPNDQIIFEKHPPVDVDPVLYLNESHTICNFAIKGVGIAKLHNYIVADALENGSLVEVLSEYHASEKQIYLYYQSSKYLEPKIRKFIDFFTS